MKRVFVLLKRSAYELYNLHKDPGFSNPSPVIENLLNRHNAHIAAIQKCKEVLDRKSLRWHSVMRDEVDCHTIQDVDLVVTVGGDGTLLHASHFLDGSVPVLGVNSDPTKLEEVEEQMGEFDATRSKGFLCGATADNFEQVLEEIIDGKWQPKTLRRISTRIDGELFPVPSLNDVLLVHPNPAAVSRCSLNIIDKDAGSNDPTVHTRSSGLRVCTAAGSTAAMQSAGGFPMPLQSTDLQYMLREPILPHPRQRHLMHGFVHEDQEMHVTWGCRQGTIYFDGAHVSAALKFGSVVHISGDGPPLQAFLQESK